MRVPAGVPEGLRAAYARCQALAATHYENFTVASRILPRDLRPHMAALYAYCRGVDDLGDTYPGDRRAALDRWEEDLRRTFAGAPPPRDPFPALAHTVAQFRLPMEPFLRLVEAGRRDQEHPEYRTFDELLEYCQLSATPVGRLVLALFGITDPERGRLSDATCTALQLANHWQDLRHDLAQGRRYLPEADLRAEGLTPEDVRLGRHRDRLRAVMRREVERTRELFRQGMALESQVPWRLAVQLRMYRLGGEAILQALARQGYDPLAGRPALSGREKAAIAVRALWPGRVA